MSTGWGAQTSGVREAIERFRALPDRLRDQIGSANEMTARTIALQAQLRLAASPSIQTRSLYNHITWSFNKRTGVAMAGVTTGATVINGVRVTGVVIAGRGGSALRSHGARRIVPSQYAHFVEYGTVHMKPEPFMRPAAASQQSAHLARVRDAGRAFEASVGARFL